MQKVLLGTDGSVTQCLNRSPEKKWSSGPLSRTSYQRHREIADNLSITEGEPVNYRIVEISTLAISGDVLIYAISHTPLSRLSPEFRDDLMKADIPIGRIIQQHHIEARRQILTAGCPAATDETGRILNLKERAILSRAVPNHPRRQTAYFYRGAVPL